MRQQPAKALFGIGEGQDAQPQGVPAKGTADCQDAGPKLDDKLEKYAPVAGISGNISSVGSDTLNNLMTLWAEGFRKHYPNVTFAVEGKGSPTRKSQSRPTT